MEKSVIIPAPQLFPSFGGRRWTQGVRCGARKSCARARPNRGNIRISYWCWPRSWGRSQRTPSPGSVLSVRRSVCGGPRLPPLVRVEGNGSRPEARAYQCNGKSYKREVQWMERGQPILDPYGLPREQVRGASSTTSLRVYACRRQPALRLWASRELLLVRVLNMFDCACKLSESTHSKVIPIGTIRSSLIAFFGGIHISIMDRIIICGLPPWLIRFSVLDPAVAALLPVYILPQPADAAFALSFPLFAGAQRVQRVVQLFRLQIRLGCARYFLLLLSFRSCHCHHFWGGHPVSRSTAPVRDAGSARGFVGAGASLAYCRVCSFHSI